MTALLCPLQSRQAPGDTIVIIITITSIHFLYDNAKLYCFFFKEAK